MDDTRGESLAEILVGCRDKKRRLARAESQAGEASTQSTMGVGWARMLTMAMDTLSIDRWPDDFAMGGWMTWRYCWVEKGEEKKGEKTIGDQAALGWA